MTEGLQILAIALTAVGLTVLGRVGWNAVRARRGRRATPAEPSSPKGPRFTSHVIEEEIPASEYGRPARWVEVTDSADRTEVDRRLLELIRTNPRSAYRLVSTPDRPAPAALARPAAGQPLRHGQEIPQMTFTQVPANAPLWQRLRVHAKTDEVTGVVAQMLYVRILGPRGTDATETGDPELVPYFRNQDGTLIDRDRLERHMSHFLMAALGGPKRYTGRGMAAAHAGRYITDEAFDRVLGHVVAVLRELGVQQDWIAEVGAAVAPLREPVVTAPTGAR